MASGKIFSDTLLRLRELKQIKDEGGFNSIPFGLPSLDRHTVGIMPGMMYQITANSGVGKSQLTKFLAIIQPYKFVKAHPELGIKLKIIWFALEESKEEFMLGLISNRLKDIYKISVSVLELQSMGERTISIEILNKIEECREYFEELEESLEIVDNVSNPYGVYKHVRNYSMEHGTHYYRKLRNEDSSVIITFQEYSNLSEREKELYCYSHYVTNDSKTFVIIVTDHLSLLSAEKNEDSNTQHKAMGKWSADYCRKQISKNYKYCIFNVQQQESAKEKLEFNYSGENIVQKLLPSLDGLANNKETQRDFGYKVAYFKLFIYFCKNNLK